MNIEDVLYLELPYGTVTIQLLPKYAPNHIARIKTLVRNGFYNGLKFHRVIDGFMVQTGCPFGTGTGGSGVNLNQEFNVISHKRGVCSMARAQDPNSADSQFFICLADSQFLDQQYTAWGLVVDGMEFVDQIKKGDKSKNGSVDDPDVIVKMYLGIDKPIEISK